MRIAVIGGGPGGLYFACLAKQLDPAREITVWERNPPGDTYGFGVVFSDETLGGIEHADPVIHERMAESFARWDDIDVHYGGAVVTSGGHGFAAMSRRHLLQILRERAGELGVDVRFDEAAPPVGDLRRSYDLVVAADGVNSTARRSDDASFGATYENRRCRYIWFGTDKVFDAFTFDVRSTPAGVMQVHAYPYDATGSTLIVEMTEEVWQKAGFAASPAVVAPETLVPGDSDEYAIERCEELFGDLLGCDPSTGRRYRLIGNHSRWINFTTLRCERWHNGNLVLLGDAAHTAHFSIGSGTKLAMEDALALVACLAESPDLPSALTAYQAERQPVVVSTQRAAQASLEWFENLHQYVDQPPLRFAFNLLTRSRRVTYENLQIRDPEFVAAVDDWFAASLGQPRRPPMFHPIALRGMTVANRVVVSAMDMYSSTDGHPGDFHLVHLGSKALGGAGLVMTEMVCVSPSGRITPGCTGLWTDEQRDGWGRITSFVHEQSPAKIGVQLGHSGRKGSTKLMWEGIDDPLPDGNWPVVGPSALPYRPVNQIPRALTVDDMTDIRRQFVSAAQRAADAGFDLLELHCAHGYLLSSYLSPLTNRRDDDYGGSLTNRLRYPVEVFDAIRAVWPVDRPCSVRISATDWAPGGVDVEDAVEIARTFAEHGVDAVDVSTGQVVSHERPAFGRSYQVPYADAIRNALAASHPNVAVIAVGAISSYDDVNSLLLAGRADLCALGRTHLFDPQWTLHAAAEQGYLIPWPKPFAAGSRRPQIGRTDGPKPRLDLIRDPLAGVTRHGRWRPSQDAAPTPPGVNVGSAG
ncbi:MAG TPA: bifunctional salicylyl-CoA 5-hydroxylase/oxidoreductase [Micromonosporaceae bacterium]|nr:bifunctional salicylyl-CoA 5-hydroxylase/oxidoreductase [Micromonosporaceae bacterium]